VNDLLENRILRWVAVLLVGIILIGFAHGSILRQVASFLIIEDTLQTASAIVPLAGQTPFREMEAAKLFQAGLAPQVVIVSDAPSAESEALRELGIKKTQTWEISRAVLIQQGQARSLSQAAKPGEHSKSCRRRTARYR
jgi:hypothetical protein